MLTNSTDIPIVYRDPRSFWQATYLTSELRRLLEEVLGRLAGQPGDRVLQMRSPFGGGKSHVLTALYHAAKTRPALDEAIPEAKKLPDPGMVRVAGVDGEKFGPQEGAIINGIKVRTLWGALAAQIGEFEKVKEHEKNLTSPGGTLVREMLGDSPTLILMDEVLSYVEKALAIQVGDSNLGRQTLNFLQTLTTEVAGSSHAVLVYSLQASSREAFDNVGLLSILDHLASRLDAKREPVVGDEILQVIKKRLLYENPSQDESREVAWAIAKCVSKWKVAEAPDDDSRRAAQDEEIRLAQRLESAYPFHVELIELMKSRWASLPNFQRTRGALRFLATVLYKSKQLNKRSPVIGPGDIPLDDADVRNAFFSEVVAEAGQRDQYQSVLEHDFIGTKARVKKIDDRLAKEKPALSAIKPAMRLATAIMMYSFGGIQREQNGEILPPGVTEKELLEACLIPGFDSITALSVLKRLRDECLFLHYDGARYCFKTQANVNKILEDEAENIKVDEIRKFIQLAIEKQVGAASNSAVIWPQKSEDIPDKEPCFLVVYLPLEFCDKVPEEQIKLAIDYLTCYSSQPRTYRNGLGLAIPDRKEIEGIRRAARYLIAIERVRKKSTSYKLNREQLGQLKEREDTEMAAFESGLRGLYSSIWLLKMSEGKASIEKLEIGGRPLRAHNIHERIQELLIDVHGKLFKTLRPSKLISLMKMGNGEGEFPALETRTIVEAFFSNPSFPVRITDKSVLVESIAQGVADGLFAYSLRIRVKEENGKYWVSSNNCVLNRPLPVEEVDLENGIILMPEYVTKDESEQQGSQQPPKMTPPPPPSEEASGNPPPLPGGSVESLTIEMTLTKTSLYKTFNVLGLLADKARDNKIRVTVEATDISGVDPTWIRNAITEPMSEANIPFEIKEKGDKSS
ncbi:MAG: DUF499 domain-containing protein [Candidatus Hadarchaeum sp.]